MTVQRPTLFRKITAFSLLGALLGAPSFAHAQLYYQGQSGGYTLYWGPEQLAYKGRDTPQTSLSEVLHLDDDPEMPCLRERATRPLSWVGPWLSLEQLDNWNCLGTAHPSAYSQWRVIDLRQPERRVSLTEIFEPQAVLAALRQDKLVQEALRESPPERPARSPEELVAQLNERNGRCEYYFDADMLSHFAIHHLKGERVAVRIGLSHGCEAARGRLTQLGLYLPLPTSWRRALNAAEKREQGFLMNWQRSHYPEDAAHLQRKKSPHYDAMLKELMS